MTVASQVVMPTAVATEAPRIALTLPARLVNVFDNAFYRLSSGESSDRIGVKSLIKALYHELMKKSGGSGDNWSMVAQHLSPLPQVLSHHQSLELFHELMEEAKSEEEALYPEVAHILFHGLDDA